MQQGYFNPTVTGTLQFGDQQESIDKTYIPQQLESNDVRLEKIKYKTTEYTSYDNRGNAIQIHYLSAIQPVYTNGAVGSWL